ncbi:Lrp/AsnC family transcriptional regulator [Agromyces sp. SYSU T00194]|uniref:Lrp/AsnC family transcriptional regulator n=1 Tax=Agromyces chitinivorans TaxID=3158560 RepID=UPI003390CCA4
MERPHDPVRIDETDIAILEVIAEDSRLSVRKIAAKVEMSAPAVSERIARLERSGVIRGYTIDLDWDRLGHEVVVYMPVTVDSGTDLAPTLSAFRDIPELEELTVIAGSYDLLARFRLADHAELRALLLDRVWQIPNVLRIETLLSLGDLATDRSEGVRLRKTHLAEDA